MSMFNLMHFFRDERDVHGTFFSANESVVNAVERRASCQTEAELLALRQGAWDFVKKIEAELMSRSDDDRENPSGAFVEHR